MTVKYVNWIVTAIRHLLQQTLLHSFDTLTTLTPSSDQKMATEYVRLVVYFDDILVSSLTKI